MKLVKYDAACKALAAAVQVDEVKKIRDAHEMLRSCARVAKNRQMETDATEIRVRAERRLGVLIAEQKKTEGLNKGEQGRFKSKTAGSRDTRPPVPTLASVGISKDMSARAQKLAAVPEEKFEAHIAGWKDETINGTAPVKIPRPEKSASRKEFERICKMPSPWTDVFCILDAVESTEKVKKLSAARVCEYLAERPGRRQGIMQMADFWPRFINEIRQSERKKTP